MGVIALLTGLGGFAVSVGLLSAGVTSMPWRYGLAISASYALFVLLLWVWLRQHYRDGDVPDFSTGSSGSKESASECFTGGGGNSGGGGASADFSSGSAVSESSVSAGEVGGVASDVTEGLGEAAGGAVAEGFAPVVLVVLALAVVGGWMLSFAPWLAAEFLVDAMLIGLLYRRLRRQPGPYLLQAIVRRTRVVFLVVLVVITLMGAWVQWLVPQARTLTQAWPLLHGQR